MTTTKNRNDVFWEEFYYEMEEESPIYNTEIWNIDGHEVHISNYDNGKTEAWIKGLGNVAYCGYAYGAKTRKEFIEEIKINIKRKN